MNQSPGTRAYIETTQYIFQKVNWPRDKLTGGEGRIKKKRKRKAEALAITMLLRLTNIALYIYMSIEQSQRPTKEMESTISSGELNDRRWCKCSEFLVKQLAASNRSK
jgi:hypothetical protein